MALARLNDFVAGTIISDSQVDAEFNQLVNALNGVNDVDVLMKFTHASNPVLNINQLGAGLIQRWQQNTVTKSRITNDGWWEYVTTSANLMAKSNQYTNTSDGTALSNSAVETSLFTGASASAGSSLVIDANTLKAGTILTFDINGFYGAVATPNVTIKIKIGSATPLQLGPFVCPNASAGSLWRIHCDMLVASIGASGSLRCRFGKVEIVPFSSGLGTATTVFGGATVTLDTTVNNTIDLTWLFGTASASNTAQLAKARIDRARG